MDTTLDLRALLHAILTCVTAGPGLGFNRAALFLANDDDTCLAPAMAIGPASADEAAHTWAALEREPRTLEELARLPREGGRDRFQELLEHLTIGLTDATAGTNPLLDAYRERRTVRIADAASLQNLPASFREVFAGTEVVCVPLLAKDRSIGLIVADNAITGEPIEENRIRLLQLLALIGGLALDNARIYRQLERQAAHLRETLGELRSTQEQLIHSERLATVGAVVARVSHEIRNPLATIGGFAMMLRNHPEDTARTTRNAEIIAAEVRTLEEFLKEMLEYTSPRPPTLAVVDLNAAIRRLAETYEVGLEQRAIQLELALAPNLPPVKVDRHQLQRLLLNLWQNAVQAMEDTPVHARVLTVRTWREDGMGKVAMIDAGCGIEPEHRERIFTPFFTTKAQGTGLGLALVRKVVDDHEGTLEIDSSLGTGTTVTVGLPLA